MSQFLPALRPRAALVAALVLALGLAACGKEEEAAPTATAPGATTPTAETAAPATPPPADETPEQIAKRADEAVDAQRLFAPPGDNAFELYLRVLDAQPNQPLARNALTDLFPYAVMHVEQRLGAGDPDDAERVLTLMEKANPQAPALPRLKTALTDARNRIVAAEAAEAQRAEREAQEAAAAREAARQAAAQPATPTPPPAAATPPPAAATPPPVATPPPAEPERPAAAPRRPAGALPPVASQVSPRYPPLALRRRVEGFVEVQFTVLPDGSVTDVSVVRSEPRSMFDREAISAMQRWRFQPSPGGEPVRGKRTFDFKLAAE